MYKCESRLNVEYCSVVLIAVTKNKRLAEKSNISRSKHDNTCCKYELAIKDENINM